MGSDNQPQYDVFLSYSNDDAKIVEELAIRIEDEASLSVWLDKWVLIPGKHWQQDMAKGIHEAKTCVVCMSNKTPKGWFKEEIKVYRQILVDAIRNCPNNQKW